MTAFEVVELACMCVDQDGQATTELKAAVAALDSEEASRLWYALGIARGMRERGRPLPPETVVGTEIVRVLGRLAGNAGAVVVLEKVLRSMPCSTG